jgi:hypothetical protein
LQLITLKRSTTMPHPLASILRPKRPEAPPPGKLEKKKKKTQKKEPPPKYTGPPILKGVRAFYLPDDGEFTPRSHPSSFRCSVVLEEHTQ